MLLKTDLLLRRSTETIAYCLEEAGARLDALDHFVFYDKPFLKFDRLLEAYIASRRAVPARSAWRSLFG